MSFDDPHWAPTFSAHASLHWLARARIGIGAIDMSISSDEYVLFWNHESIRSDAAGSPFAIRAVAYQTVGFRQRDVY